MATADTPKPDSTTRLVANSIAPVCRRVKIMAAQQVHRGNDGTLQEFMNYVLLGLSQEKQEVVDKYFDRGEAIWQEMIAGKITK